MTDRELIRALHICAVSESCGECPYYRHTDCDKALMLGAADRIQEAVENKDGMIWHPYPQEKPKEIGFYFVSLKGGSTSVELWIAEKEDWLFFETVTAWMPIPKPYKED